MGSLVLIAIIGLLGGVAIGLQAPLASTINLRLGMLESIFIVHLGGFLAAGIPLLLLGGGRLGQWAAVPGYAYAAGLMGVVVVGSTVYMVPRIGVAAAITLIVTGQLLIAVTVDHFGILGVEMRKLSLDRLMGVSAVLFGVWWTLRH